MKAINNILVTLLFSLAVLGYFCQNTTVSINHLNNKIENTSTVVDLQDNDLEERFVKEECLVGDQISILQANYLARKLYTVYFQFALNDLEQTIWIPPKIS